MEYISRRKLIGIMGGTLGVLLFGLGTSAGSGKYQTYTRPQIEVPVSLAVGTVRTPEFRVKNQNYHIIIQAERRLPFADMLCMMGLTTGPLSRFNCDKEPLLQADWTVWDGENVVAQGSVHERDGYFDSAKEYLFRYLGNFVGKAGKKYVLEVKFAKDGTPLNATNPHLIVM